jgi:hypothetical protein
MRVRFCVPTACLALILPPLLLLLLLLLLLFTVAGERFVLHFAIEEYKYLQLCPLFCMGVKLGRSHWKKKVG